MTLSASYDNDETKTVIDILTQTGVIEKTVEINAQFSDKSDEAAKAALEKAQADG